MANLYTIESLLIGKTYNSRTMRGEIIHAEKDNRCVHYGDNLESYLVEIRNPRSLNTAWRTLAVKVGE